MTWEIGAYSVGSTLPTPTALPIAVTGWDIGAYRAPAYYYYYVNMPVGSDSYYVNFPVVSTYDYYINLLSAGGLPTPEDRPVATTGWEIGAYSIFISSPEAQLLYTLDNPNPFSTSTEDGFGLTVAADGEYAIIGAPYEDDAQGAGTGKAYIYNTTTGVLVHTLSNPNAYDTNVDDAFGYSVAISGDYAIVGAPYEDDAGPKGPTEGTQSGKAYIFDVITGALVHTLDNPNAYDTSIEDQFGYAVSISGNYAIVGAPYEDDASGLTGGSGKAYIFDVTTGTLLYTLDNPNSGNASVFGYDLFGFAVSVSGTRAIVGAYSEDDAGNPQSGKAYVFDVTTGTLLYTLDNPNTFGTSANDLFGGYLDISTSLAVVSAIVEDDAGGTESGVVYVFNALNGALLHTLVNPNAFDTSASDNFGSTVAISSGNYVIVGARGEDDAGGADSGKAYIFDGLSGELVYTLDNPNAYDTSAGDRFGTSVAIGNNYAIVNAYREDDENGIDSGKAYIFEAFTGSSFTLERAQTDTTDDPYSYNTSYGWSIAIDGDRIIVGAFSKYDGENSIPLVGEARVYELSTNALLSVLKNPIDPQFSQETFFGDAVDISGDYAIASARYGSVYIFNVTTGALVHTLPSPSGDAVVGISGDYAVTSAFNNHLKVYSVTTGALIRTIDNPGVSTGFGADNDISGDYAIVGSYFEDKAYIFNVTTGALVHTLNNPDPYDGGSGFTDQFGYSVAISGDYAIVGAWREDDAGGLNSGKAYIFDVITGALVHTLDNPNAYDTSTDDEFGESVAISSNYAIVGAYQEDDATGLSSGKAYIFDVTTGVLLKTLDNPNIYVGNTEPDWFGRAVAISDDWAAVGAPQETWDAPGYGALNNTGYVYLYKSS